jgi:4-diphosphocytidyl-2C-methyl-D-erythritol kinase
MKKYSPKCGVEIIIDKKIPVGAGLAGGSTDCAATLRALNRLWQLGLSPSELASVGATIGSDVPYCVHGGTALVKGRGEIVEKIAALPHCWVILVKPRKSVSTANIFRKFVTTHAAHPDINLLKKALDNKNFAEMTKHMENSLEAVTAQFLPEIEKIKKRALALGAQSALMSGSGSSVFGISRNYQKALRIFNGLRGFNSEVYLVRSL